MPDCSSISTIATLPLPVPGSQVMCTMGHGLISRTLSIRNACKLIQYGYGECAEHGSIPSTLNCPVGLAWRGHAKWLKSPCTIAIQGLLSVMQWLLHPGSSSYDSVHRHEPVRIPWLGWRCVSKSVSGPSTDSTRSSY